MYTRTCTCTCTLYLPESNKRTLGRDTKKVFFKNNPTASWHTRRVHTCIYTCTCTCTCKHCTCTCTSRTAALTSMPGRRVCTGTRLSPGMREEKTVLGLTETGTDLASGPAHTTHCNTCPRHNGFPRLRSLTNSAAFFLSKKPVLLWIPKATMYPWSSTLCTQQGRTWGGGDTGTVCINKKSFVFECCCGTVFIVYSFCSIFVRISFHSVCMRLRLAVCMYMCMHEGLVNAEQRMVYSYNQIARGTCMKLPAIAACS